jgi:adenylosuccinate lyase
MEKNIADRRNLWYSNPKQENELQLFPATGTITWMNNFDQYQSPYSWRYASAEMRKLWGEKNKRLIWREIWLALAEVQAEFGLVKTDQIEDLRSKVEWIDMDRSLTIEAEIHHDLMAELKTYAEQCPVGGGILHLGATSMDIEDNADALRIRSALRILLDRLEGLLKEFATRIEDTADLTVIGYTHLQPAEPTTLGYRLAFYAQDLLDVYQALNRILTEIRGKGFKGAVGNAAAYAELLGGENLEDFEQRLSQKLQLEFYPVTSQTYPRRQDYVLLSELAGLGGVLYKFAFDLRLLQSPPFGEWREPFTTRQVGSSAMPFKRNPISAEKIDSLARALALLPQIAWGNAAHSLLERTLDDSANRRSLIPEAFLISDELLMASTKLVRGIQFDRISIDKNLQTYAPFAAIERVLMALVGAGADRQMMHELLRKHALAAWDAIRNGEPNLLQMWLSEDTEIREYLKAEAVLELMNVDGYTGLASRRAIELAQKIRSEIKNTQA